MSYIKTRLIENFRKVRAFALKGRRYYCPVCDGWYRKFLKANRVVMYSNVKCPGCLSLERHRLLWMALCYLQNKGEIYFGGRILNIDPESCLEKKFMQVFDYLSIDLDEKKAMLSMDVTKLDLKDESFNAIVCNHILEHIPDDRKALAELFRVLAPGGWAVIQVPIKGEFTQEDLTINNPQERLRVYGQADHVRCYGRDFFDRLRAVGFDVQLVSKTEITTPEEMEYVSVAIENEVVLCRKTKLIQK